MRSLMTVTCLVLALGTGAKAAEISISCSALGQEYEICKQGVDAWAAKTGNTIRIVSTPNSATERLALYQQLLAAGASDVDVFQIDVVWPGLLSQDLVDLREAAGAAADEHLPAMTSAATVDGRLVALPWFADAGMLYYRKDLLEAAGKEPPKTWEELSATAKDLQDKARADGNDRMWGYVFQGKAYEGLTCNGLEWIDSFGGGTIVDDEGKITINNDKAAQALTWAASAVSGIAPEGVLNYSEEESRGVFQSGNAIFMRNWPYAWALAQAEDSPIKCKIGVVPLPKGGADGKHTGALGGWQLAVSKYSRYPDISIDLVRYLTSAEEQKRRAIEGSYNPTIKALYQDEEVLKAVPFFGTLYETFTSAVARPSRVTTTKYNQMSSEFFNAVHQVLSKQAEPADALSGLERRLDRLSRGGRW
jgi:trehalose/maltose transport system substrate-binding protein